MLRVIKFLSIIPSLSSLFIASNKDSNFRSILFTVVPSVENNKVSYEMACLFNEDCNYLISPLTLTYSDRFSFSSHFVEDVKQPLLLYSSYKLTVKDDGTVIDLEMRYPSDGIGQCFKVNIEDKTNEEKGKYTGVVPAVYENGNYYDDRGQIISTDDIFSFFEHQLLEKYPYKLSPNSIIDYCYNTNHVLESEFEKEMCLFKLYSQYRDINYIISDPSGALVDIESLNVGDELYLIPFEDYLYGYAYNPFNVDFDTSILKVEDYNLFDITISHNNGGVINE